MTTPQHPTDTVDVPEAVVYIVSQHTNPPAGQRRVLWRMTVTDAKKVCNDPRTAGTHSMLVFSTANIDDPVLNRYIPDRGTHADVLTELDVTVLASHSSPPHPPTLHSRPPGRGERS